MIVKFLFYAAPIVTCQIFWGVIWYRPVTVFTTRSFDEYLLAETSCSASTLGNSLSIMSQNIQMNFILLHEKQINLNGSHVICHDLKSNVVSKHSDTQDQKLVAISVCVTCCHKAFLECLKFEKLDHLESRV